MVSIDMGIFKARSCCKETKKKERKKKRKEARKEGGRKKGRKGGRRASYRKTYKFLLRGGFHSHLKASSHILQYTQIAPSLACLSGPMGLFSLTHVAKQKKRKSRFFLFPIYTFSTSFSFSI